MSKENVELGGVILLADNPTILSQEKLFRWVIWQFPRPYGAGLCGAVHPPIAGHGWYPAIIKSKEKDVQVFANILEPYPSPEKAILFFKVISQ